MSDAVADLKTKATAGTLTQADIASMSDAELAFACALTPDEVARAKAVAEWVMAVTAENRGAVTWEIIAILLADRVTHLTQWYADNGMEGDLPAFVRMALGKARNRASELCLHPNAQTGSRA